MKDNQNRATLPACGLCSPDERIPCEGKPRYKEFSEKVYACNREVKGEQQ